MQPLPADDVREEGPLSEEEYRKWFDLGRRMRRYCDEADERRLRQLDSTGK